MGCSEQSSSGPVLEICSFLQYIYDWFEDSQFTVLYVNPFSYCIMINIILKSSIQNLMLNFWQQCFIRVVETL